MLDTPPAAVLDDIQASYSPGTQGAVSYNGQVWGYPTELNTYQLLYNKKMLLRSRHREAAGNLRRAGRRDLQLAN